MARVIALFNLLVAVLLSLFLPIVFPDDDSRFGLYLPLVNSVKFSPFVLPRYPHEVAFSHLWYSLKKTSWLFSILQNNHRHRNKRLLCSGDIKNNPGPSAPHSTYQKKKKLTSALKKNLKILHLNVRSLPCHFDEVQSFVHSQKADIFAVTESWLDSSVPDCEVSLSDYHLYRCDRSRSGGGVAVYVADYLSGSFLSSSSVSGACSDVEFLWLSISSFKSSLTSFAFGCFYRPPGLPASSIHNLCSNIESMLISHKHVIVCGDLNVDTSDLNHPHSKSLLNFISSHSLSCPITDPTRISDSRCSVIDHFLASSDVPISHSAVLNISISDHLPIVLSVDWSTPKTLHKTITKRSFKNFSTSSFNDDLVSVPWFLLDLFDDVDDKVFLFNALFADVLDTHAPVKTVS